MDENPASNREVLPHERPVRMFAESVAPGKSRRVRKLFVPEFDPESWRPTLGGCEPSWLLPASSVARSTVKVGSVDLGTVSYGWSVVEFAPINSAAGRAAQPTDSGEPLWIRVPVPSTRKNVEIGHAKTEWHDAAFRLVHWQYESMFEHKSKPTKEQAVALAVTRFYVPMLRSMESMGVRTIVIEQQLGMQNILATCLSHALQALVLAMYPEWTVEFIAPQLTVPLFVSILHCVPRDFPFEAARVVDLKEKPQKKYASGLCAAFCLLLEGSLARETLIQRVWRSVPCSPDPKYDDISDSLWNAVAWWNKRFGAQKKTARKRTGK